MGDEILKHIVKISLFILLFCSLAMANEAYKNSIKEYDKFFREIGEKRVGVDEKIIDSVKNFKLPNIGDKISIKFDSLKNKLTKGWNSLKAKIGFDLERKDIVKDRKSVV